jgi:hypothetical protein
MYNNILQINKVNKTSKRLKNDVDIENHRIIQTERPLVFFGMQVELAFGAITRWCFEGQQEMLRQHFE